jgi:hypothetical protein
MMAGMGITRFVPGKILNHAERGLANIIEELGANNPGGFYSPYLIDR